jgi:hypothetical protein
MNDFVIELRDNALDSLTHGIEHFMDGGTFNLKYALLHVAQAVELFLKARLAAEHPLLVQLDPAKVGGDSKTVGWDGAYHRLVAAGIQLPHGAHAAITALHAARNRVQHHRLETTRAEVQSQIGQGIRFLESFLSAELDLSLSDELDETFYLELRDAIYTYEEALKKAEAELESRLAKAPRTIEPRRFHCAECGQYTVLFPRESGSDTGRCYFCGVQPDFDTVVRLAEAELEHDLRDGGPQQLCCPECGNETLIYPDLSNSSGLGKCYFCGAEPEVFECLRCERPVFSEGIFCDACSDFIDAQ